MDPTTPLQVATFCIAVLALVASLLALGWNIAQWLLSGGRARVELSVGFVEKISTRYALFPLSPNGLEEARKEMERNNINGDLAYFITVRNVGRTALTVRSVQFRVDPTREAFGTMGGGDWGDKTPARVETGDSVVIGMSAEFLIDMAAVVRNKHKGMDPVVMRAEADLGTGKTVTSKAALSLKEEAAEAA